MMAIRKPLAFLLAGLTVFLTPLAASAGYWSQNDRERDETDRKTQIYYYQKEGSGKDIKTNIMRKYGDRDPEKVYSIPGYPRDYRISSDYRYMTFDYGDSVKYMDMNDGRLRDAYRPRYGMGGMAYSPDYSNMMFFDYNRKSRDYLLYNYDLQNDRGSYYGKGRLSSEFHLLTWRPDGKIIFMEERGNQKIIWSLDLATRKFTRSNYTNPDWISNDGRYMSVPSRNYRAAGYNDYRDFGYGYGKTRVVDPVTGRSYGDFGGNRYRDISGYDPASNKIYYSEYDSRTRHYPSKQYSYDPDNRSLDEVNLDDVNLAAASRVVNYGNFWVIFVNDDALIRSDQPVGIIDEYPDYDWD